MTLTPGTTLGRYQILGQLGQGGMATVYKAYQPSLDRTVALKVVRQGFAEDKEFMGRFEREAKAVARLRHPHIVQVHDYDEQEGRAFLVMEYVEGGTLKERSTELAQRGQRLPPREVARIVTEIAEALGYAHGMGIVHRDVKPSNVMLSRDGKAVVSDFGIAKILSAQQQTATGVGLGTPEYMSPEQGQGQQVDGRSDIYSLGVLAYELLCGRLPYAAETPFAVVMAHVRDPLPLPSQVNPEIGPSTERVLLKALAKTPAERFGEATAFASALAQAIAEDGRVTGDTRAPTVVPVAHAPIAVRTTGPSRRVLAGALAAVVLVVGATGAYASGLFARVDTGTASTTTSSTSVPSGAGTSRPSASPSVITTAAASSAVASVGPLPLASLPGSMTQAPGLAPAITGTVTSGATGQAVGGATVSVFRDRTTAVRVAIATTDAAGGFRVSVAAGTYQVQFQPPVRSGLGTVWWQNATNVTVATSIVLSGEARMQVALPSGHDIVGRVFAAATGQGVPSSTVRATYVSGTGCPTYVLVTSDATGVFRLPVAEGSYIVLASPPAPYYPLNYPAALICSDAQPVEVRGADVAGIDLALKAGSQISGFIIDAAGAPVGGARAAIFLNGPASSGAGLDSVGTPVADRSGHWSTYLADGTYRIRFEASADLGYKELWWNGALSFPRAADIVVKGAAIANINGQLSK